MTPEQKFCYHFNEMAELCGEQGWGNDPFNYSRSKEIYASIVLGHKVADTFSGADAFNSKGEPVEYKSTIGKNNKGSYTGISVKATWEEQEAYLENEKIAKYPEHFYNRFQNGKLVESWKLDGDTVLSILKPKLRKKFDTLQKKIQEMLQQGKPPPADPRLSAQVSWTEIQRHGTKVI